MNSNIFQSSTDNVSSSEPVSTSTSGQIVHPIGCKQSKAGSQGKRKVQEALFDLVNDQRKAQRSGSGKDKNFREMLDMKYIMMDADTISNPVRRCCVLLKQKQALRQAEEIERGFEDEDESSDDEEEEVEELQSDEEYNFSDE
ncbi:hypothetical protein PHYBLDRAFT_139428 [Phycomyces blakesleeanus NRRL 1555(-)]|uniref:No apical meristem-associated C-terminal domain-containing protein n=1 Tax=Phycomyces blakesleeanus (strain ATCC 8743b / DSM 1359 / FGSC 10004 / NBRC 33097 / NRRL 1555) TaxID=763407 RepID=A0A167QB08_PHYB8|nr:hypothetical protein PHYBLDRAFT_139428 [Phycomyces blakesleeanus NRRL 1555(-)]OAD79397.1 hypothetical protein PHYBLDRAFT_139428 [Phycomyces blakesleeanus NRRL 1555(-)]|eukprot:XP_018297437.1 hypothetical protein PHYBLDRAFT_139428 [Phycomyces blakesleeanus NRRL 1555(-)]